MREGNYGSTAAFVFIFNLIVGVGSLALPYVFSKAGLVLGSVFLALFAFVAYVTATFVIEAQAAGNALLCLNNGDEPSFEIKERIEMAQLAHMFLGERGYAFFLVAICAYLLGDLAIYAIAVPQTLYTFCNRRILLPSIGVHLIGMDAYRVFVALFAVVVLPFCYFSFSNTRYVQYATLSARHIAFIMMIAATLAFIADPDSEFQYEHVHRLPMANWSQIGVVFGTAIYSFMSHHSLPSIITPIRDKRGLSRLLALDYCAILFLYLVLCWTAVLAFQNAPDSIVDGAPSPIQTLYTLNFKSYHIRFVAVFVVLFPVFSISSNYPLIAITFRNNLLSLVPADYERLRHPAVVSTLASLPPVLIALGTMDLGIVVSLTGAIGGLCIQFLIPTFLVYASRRYWSSQHDDTEATRLLDPLAVPSTRENTHQSPFAHPYWIPALLCFSAVSLALSLYDVAQR